MSLEKEHHIDVMVIQGQDGTVHVRTPENMEDAFVDSQFEEITEGIGAIATAGVEIEEPPRRTAKELLEQSNGKTSRPFSKRGDTPSKIKK